MKTTRDEGMKNGDFADGSAAYLADTSGFPGEMRAALNVEEARAAYGEHR